ncbi:MAG: arginine--tRNA ligase [Bacteroidales bacterium]|nr:arginine--tRNA ligase [Bacteroidales bacterium]
MSLESTLSTALQETLLNLYQINIDADPKLIQPTRKEFSGDRTIVVFPYVKQARKAPDMVANEIGTHLCQTLEFIDSYNVVKGYLNITLKDSFWSSYLSTHFNEESYGLVPTRNEAPVLIEYSSPNTNKPLHLGHVRNNLLGHSVSKIAMTCGHPVVQVNLVNDRGIHICKSMVAWLRYGNGETPESSSIKGDHLVGNYYVAFDKHYKEEQQQLLAQGLTPEEAEQQAPIMLEAREMLRQWEAGDPTVRALWQQMNSWVYAGFDQTYKRLGIHFDKVYHESETYLLGKALVEEGLSKGVFYKHEDGSVRVNLEADGLDEKVLLRKDGTSVYITQDIGTAQLRYEEFHPQKMIYVVGNEQNYHFDVLKLILGKKLERPFGDSILHLSYGMVELPNGKMKSREGTVVDADDLMDAMYDEAKASTEALGKFQFTPEEADKLYEMVGLGALKYFILKVDPTKNMLFNPEESIDFNGNTAPFIQYTHARICSLLRKADEQQLPWRETLPADILLNDDERELVKTLYQYPGTVLAAGDNFSPALIANYIYDLSKQFNRFYQETPVMKEADEHKRLLRLQIARMTAITIHNGMDLLGIKVPERM